MVPLFGLLFRQRPAVGTWIGAILAVIGLYFLSVTESFAISKGDFLVLLSAFFWAAHVLLIGWLSPRVNSLKLASAQFAICAVLSFFVALNYELISLTGICQGLIPILYVRTLFRRCRLYPAGRRPAPCSSRSLGYYSESRRCFLLQSAAG